MYLEELKADSAALAAAARLGVSVPVPSCPDWDVAALVDHVGRIHRWVASMVATHASERPPRSAGDPLPPFEEVSAELVEVLSAADDDEPVWNWSVNKPHTAAFWKRRMAHETAVHRWDAQLAHGRPEPIDAALAKDGIDEVLDMVLPTEMSLRTEPPSLGGSLHLHTTDVAGEWVVRVEDGKVDVAYEHGKGDAAVRGTAEDVLLFVWGRKRPEELETFGDAAVVANWSNFTR